MFILIPAKLNSSRLKQKNLKKINNKTLLEISIKFAQSLNIKKKIFVSSESKKILEIAKKFNCETILRPKSLSKSNTEMKLVINHFIKLKKLINDDIMLLQPTSPIRQKSNIIKAYKIFKKKKIKGIYSVNEVFSGNLKSVTLDSEKKIKLLTKKNYLFLNSQVLPKLYKFNGNFFIFKSKYFLEEGEIPIKKSIGFKISIEEAIDIDDLIDFKRVKKSKFFKKS
tara:strand:- start:226 stop:900 length:675 start_codon:yes stop_codon:yes gene_type:complete